MVQHTNTLCRHSPATRGSELLYEDSFARLAQPWTWARELKQVVSCCTGHSQCGAVRTWAMSRVRRA
jgi:hypothetical protein